MTELTNLLDLSIAELGDFFTGLGEPSYRATQLIKWMHQTGASDFSGMTNLSKVLREKLQGCAEIKVPEIVNTQDSSDGTSKWLLRLSDGNCIETVFIPEDERGTLCVSSQVGCALNCSFCATARQGFSRNLTLSEIIGQVWLAVRQLSKKDGVHDKVITNVVMMGMGEPLLNFNNVVNAMDIMMHDVAYNLSKYRVTLSTSGVVPAMERLSKVSEVALAVSLHAPNDALRNMLVPINKKYDLKKLMEICRTYFDDKRRKIVFEYVMLDGVNDTIKHARELITILQGIPAKVNLIPFNPFPHAGYTRSSDEKINAFRDRLMQAGIITLTRKTRGDDIDAACGQLVGDVNDKTRRQEQWKKVVANKEQEQCA